MKVLLTGAAGFVGSHVARALLARGLSVYAPIRPGGRMDRIADIQQSLNTFACDLAATDEINQHIEIIRPDLCIHLAWQVTAGGIQSSIANLESLTASLNLCAKLASVGCRRLVAAGSCFEYDADAGYLSEDSPTKSASMYEASKLSALYMFEQMCEVSGMELAWPRLFPLYGPCEAPQRLVPSVILALLAGREAETTSGEQVRDYLHVADAAEAICCMAESEFKGIVNIGSGRPVLVSDVIEAIASIIGRNDLLRLGARPYRENEPMFICANNQRLLTNTDWRPRFSLAEGLLQTVEWWQGQVSNVRPEAAQ